MKFLTIIHGSKNNATKALTFLSSIFIFLYVIWRFSTLKQTILSDITVSKLTIIGRFMHMHNWLIVSDSIAEQFKLQPKSSGREASQKENNNFLLLLFF